MAAKKLNLPTLYLSSDGLHKEHDKLFQLDANAPTPNPTPTQKLGFTEFWPSSKQIFTEEYLTKAFNKKIEQNDNDEWDAKETQENQCSILDKTESLDITLKYDQVHNDTNISHYDENVNGANEKTSEKNNNQET